ncbi:MAG TPA: hypothetical protein VH300_13635 [Thermoleophilaceae bacterium]|nr:hypothetical protein [Thermoleophilaceae bacterium]
MGHRWLIVGAIALAGCGPTPPQAPGPEAHQLNTTLSAFSTACGHATEIQAFSDDAHALALTEQQAQKEIATIAKIYKRNRAWIFQGKTVAELVQMSETFLDECGLHATARRLRAATS